MIEVIVQVDKNTLINANNPKCEYCENQATQIIGSMDIEHLGINIDNKAEYIFNGLYLCDKHMNSFIKIMTDENLLNKHITHKNISNSKFNLRRLIK